jgi:tetratricopeptide (TPR) repeat protein
VRAGDAASASAATDQAIACYQQAITLWSGSTAEHADALVRLGMALSASGRQLEADERFRSALQLAEAIDDAVLLARAALGLSATLRYGHSDPSRIAALELAIERLGPAEGVLRPAALAMLMRQLGFDPSAAAYARRQEAAGLVLEAVSKPDPPEQLLLALGAARDSIPVDEPVALGRLTRQIIAAATARRELPILANAWYGQAWSTLELGDAAGWRAAIAGYTAVANELQLPYELSLAAAMAATDALIRGRYADAERRSQEALAHAAVTGDENASAVHLTNAVLRGIDLGQAPEMLELMRAVRNDYVNVPTFLAGLTLTAAAAGDAALAGSLLDEQAAAGFDSIRHDAEWLPVVGFLASACAMAGVNRHAEALHAILATSPATTVRVGPLAGWWGPIALHLGALCRLLGDLDQAERHLVVALDVAGTLGSPPFEARTEVELAALLDQRGAASTRGRAAALRQSATATARELAAPGLVAAFPR